MKNVFKTLFIIVIVLPLILYMTIHITNNHIATLTLNELKDYEMPAGATLEDSFSAAGKFTGSGNGMQYMGAILVSGDINYQAVAEHYQAGLKNIEVRELTTPVLEFETSKDYSFKVF